MTNLDADPTTVTGRTDPWRTLARASGIFGLAGIVLLFGPAVAISTLGEPEFDGSPEEVSTFFTTVGDTGWVEAGQALFGVGMLALLWFFVGLTALLRQVEGDPAWRSTAGLLSITVLTSYGLIQSSWEAAANRGADTDPAVALYAFDVGNLGFANVWLAMASFALALGWVLLESRALPRWCGWWALATGAGLVAARFVWESSLWFLPYGAFWFGAIALAVRLVRRGQLASEPSTG